MKRFLIWLFLISLLACKPSPKVLWKFQTGAPVYASPSVWRNSVIIGSNDHFLYSLDADSGKVLWKRNMGERILSKPLIQNDVIYIGTASGNFLAMDPANGNVKWTFRTPASIQYDACGDQDAVYFGSWDNNFYKVAKKDGSKIWEYKGAFWFTGYCDFYKNIVLTSSWDKHDYGLDRASGAAVWKFPSGNFNYGGPQIAGDRVYFATHSSLFILNGSNGQKIYERKTGYLKDTVISNGYLWTYDAGLTKRNLDGEKIASIPLSFESETQPVAGNGFIIVSVDNQLFAVSHEMKLLWKFKSGESFWCPGVIYKDVYYAGNRDSIVYALRLPH